MKWVTKDIQTFIEAREYVDTVLIPLYGISFAEGMNKSASSVELISIISQQIEKQFKGRILMLPGLTYCYDWDEREKKEFILRWKASLEKEHFSHIFFLTDDEDWKLCEEQLDGSLLWTPFIPLDHLEDKYKKTIVEEEINHILNSIIHNWRKV